MLVCRIVKYKLYTFINQIQVGRWLNYLSWFEKSWKMWRKSAKSWGEILENTSFTRKSWRTPDYCYTRLNTWFLYSSRDTANIIMYFLLYLNTKFVSKKFTVRDCFVILSDPPFKEGYDQFTTEPLKLLSDKNVEFHVVFLA